MIIAHLYDDLLNLYGESGNIQAVENVLSYNRIKYKVVHLSLQDTLDFSKYDFVYIGSGTEKNLKLALQHLSNYKEDIKQYIESGKFLLATGNALELFGTSLLDNEDKPYEGLGIFDYRVLPQPRKMEEVWTTTNLISSKIIGFINHKGNLDKIDNPLFEQEGIHYKNFYGTYTLGPILVRNPDFLRYFMNELMGKKLRYDLKLEKKAYETFIHNNEEVM